MQSGRSDISVCSRSRYNPITGEQIAYASRAGSASHSRPPDVPALPLRGSSAKPNRALEDDENRYRPIFGPSRSPDRASTVSWGSNADSSRQPLRAPYACDDSDMKTDYNLSVKKQPGSVCGSEISVCSRNLQSSAVPASDVPRLFASKKRPDDRVPRPGSGIVGVLSGTVQGERSYLEAAPPTSERSGVRGPEIERRRLDNAVHNDSRYEEKSSTHRRYNDAEPESERRAPVSRRDASHSEDSRPNPDKVDRNNRYDVRGPHRLDDCYDEDAGHIDSHKRYQQEKPTDSGEGRYGRDDPREALASQRSATSNREHYDSRREGPIYEESSHRYAGHSVGAAGDSERSLISVENTPRIVQRECDQGNRYPFNKIEKRGFDSPIHTVDEAVQSEYQSERSTDRLARQMHSLWQDQSGPKSVRPSQGYEGDQELYNQAVRKEDLIVETVIADQLAKTPGCEREMSRHMLNSAIKHIPGMPRGSIRPLHESKVRTGSSQAEHMLANRVRFSARLITPKGQDAVRELAGFFFNLDGSLTLYEYRQLAGKSPKALPLLTRGTHEAVWGRCRGEPISLLDLFEGNTLYLSSKNQSGLPNSLRSCPLLKIRITDVDDEAKREALELGLEFPVPDSQWNKILAKLHMSRCPLDPRLQLDLRKLQERVRDRVVQRSSVGVWTALYSVYNNWNKTGSSTSGEGSIQLSRDQLEEGVIKVRLDLSDNDLDLVWSSVDPDDIGDNDLLENFHFTEYMKLVLGEMNEARRRNVRKAFLKMDSPKNGYVSITDIHRFYRIGSQSSSNDAEESHLVCPSLTNLLDILKFSARQDIVTFTEFEIVYEGLSAPIRNDQQFILGIKRAWNI